MENKQVNINPNSKKCNCENDLDPKPFNIDPLKK